LPGVDQITEIGAVKYENGAPQATFVTLINPRRSIPETSARISGITDEMVIGKPTIDEVLESFAEFCDDLVVVAHNAPFDYQFLTADIQKFEASAPCGIVLDTCQMSRKVFPGLLNYKLATLVQHLGIPATGFHRAGEDAGYAGQLFLKILEKISVGGQIAAIETMIALSNNQALKFPKMVKQPKQLDLLGFEV
jgi:DNA polymerase-3 subunit epsilon